ncbi:HIT family protein [hydrothermal vent metagenome]|uniref:HIT family protein n=1 Tax=hydrothermal vent metagenome TaxID=652676 RepID=A0A1W1BZV8_9ZZZZ
MCLFCKIVKKEIPANIELENEECIAFPQTMALLTPFIQEVAKKVGIDKSGYRVITNIGEDGGQEIKHLHFHILGGAKLKWEHLSDADPKDFI